MSYQLNDTAYSILALGGTMATMKMEKLVYYTNIECVKQTGEFLFPENFQAWSVGPVCPQLFGKHRGLFAISINDFRERCPKARLLEEPYLSMARKIVADYGQFTGRELSEQFKRSRTPWTQARGNLKSYDPGTEANTITKEMLRAYYL